MAAVYAGCRKVFNIDPLSEKYSYQSHYNFSENRLTDGRELEGLEFENVINADGDFTSVAAAPQFAKNTGGYVTLRDGEIPEVTHDIEGVTVTGQAKGGNNNGSSNSGNTNNISNSSAGNFNIPLGISNGASANVASATAGAGVISQTGGGVSAGTMAAVEEALGSITRVLGRVSLWSLPLMLNGDAAKTDDKNFDDIPITLYRGVHVGHPDYKNALKGTAVPAGGNATPEQFNGGNYKGPFTAWSMSRSVANYHANKEGEGGVVLIKQFLMKQTVPSPDNFDELEVLVPGVVKGALPTKPTGPGTRTAY